MRILAVLLLLPTIALAEGPWMLESLVDEAGTERYMRLDLETAKKVMGALSPELRDETAGCLKVKGLSEADLPKFQPTPLARSNSKVRNRQWNQPRPKS